MMKRAPDNVRYLPAGPQSRARRSRDCVVLIGRPSRADCGDRLPFDRQIDIAAIEMGLCRLVPGDESGDVANDFPRHGWFVRIRREDKIIVAVTGQRPMTVQEFVTLHRNAFAAAA